MMAAMVVPRHYTVSERLLYKIVTVVATLLLCMKIAATDVQSSLICPDVEDYHDTYAAIVAHSDEVMLQDLRNVHAEVAPNIQCSLHSVPYARQANLQMSVLLYQMGDYVGSRKFALRCLKQAILTQHCTNLYMESNYRLGNEDVVSFYSHFHHRLYGSDSSPIFQNTRGLQSTRGSDLYTRYCEQHNVETPADALSIEAFLYLNSNKLTVSAKLPYCRRFADQLVSSPAESKPLQWDVRSPIKIYAAESFSFAVPFDEAIRGLSETLSYLGIANKVVSIVEPEDTSLYILLHNTPYSGLSNGLPKHYILWNSAAYPSVNSQNLTEVNATSATYTESAVAGAVAIWDSRRSSLHIWDRMATFESSKLFYVPPIHSLRAVLQSCVDAALDTAQLLPLPHIHDSWKPCRPTESTQTATMYSLYSCEHTDLVQRPIDVLFYGAMTPYRMHVMEAVQKEAARRGWKVKTDFTYSKRGTAKDTAIDQAKVIMNLNRFERLSGHSDARHSSNALNMHRIRDALGRGRVVVSEASDNPADDAEFDKIVLFASSVDGLIARLAEVLEQPEMRLSIEHRAVEYMAREHTKGLTSSALDVFTTAIMETLERFKSDRRTSHPTGSGQCVATASDLINELDIEMADDSKLALAWLSHVSSSSPNSWIASVYPTHTRSFAAVIHSHEDAVLKTSSIDINSIVGYLQRRYRYTGGYMYVGDTENDGLKHSAKPPFRKITRLDLQTDSRVFFETALKTHVLDKTQIPPDEQYDLIVFDNHAQAAQLYESVNLAIQLLARNGTILLANSFAPNEHEASMPKPETAFFWCGDVWRVVVLLRQRMDVDLAMLDVAWGYTVVKARASRRPVFADEVNWKKFARTTDRILPVLSMMEMHEWLNE